MNRSNFPSPLTSAAQGRTVPFVASRGARPPQATPGRLGDVGEAPLVVAIQAVGVAVHVRGVEIEVAVLVVVEPDGADGLPRVGQSDLGRDVGEPAGRVAEQHVGAIAKADKQIEIAVGVDVDPGRLAHGAGTDRQTGVAGYVHEAPAIVAIEPQHRRGWCRGGREPDEQIGIAVGVEVSPRRGARRPRVGDAGRRRHVGEDARVVAIQPVRRAVEPDEQIDVAVAVVIRGGVDERAAGGEQLRLDRFEPWWIRPGGLREQDQQCEHGRRSHCSDLSHLGFRCGGVVTRSSLGCHFFRDR